LISILYIAKQQRDLCRDQSTEGEPKRDPANLTLGRQSRNLAPQEVWLVQDLSEVFTGLVGLLQRWAIGPRSLGMPSSSMR
jgi:hypothetical protein